MLTFHEICGTANELVSDLVPINWVIKHLLPLYRCELIAVFKPLIDLELAVFRPPNQTTNWTGLLVQRKDAIRLLDKALHKQPDDNIDVDEFATMICLQPDVAAQVVRCTPLTYSRWGCGCRNIHLSVIQDFLHRYVVINRFCVENEVNLNDVISHLDCLPIEYPELRKSGCYILSRNGASDAVLNEICRIYSSKLPN